MIDSSLPPDFAPVAEEPNVPSETAAPPGRRIGRLMAVIAVATVAYAGLWVAGGFALVSEDTAVAALGRFMVRFAAAGAIVIPFVPLVVLAQVGQSAPAARLLTLGYWMLLATGCLLVLVGLTMGALLGLKAGVEPADGRAILEAMPPGGWARVALATLLGCGAILVGFLCFLPPGRALAARLLPVQSDSFTDTAAVATALPLLIGCFIPLIVLGDAPVLMLLRNKVDNPAAAELSQQGSLFDLYAQLAWAVPVSLLAAGWPLTRTLPAALARLGVVRPTARQLAAAVAIAIALVVAIVGYEATVAWLWKRLGWPTTDETTVEKMLEFALTPAGAVAIGITAGVSEELAFRGLLQPRLGILVSNLLFAAMHAFQYHWDGLIGVFLIGLVCGLVRKHANTTSAMIVHGLYDAILVSLAVITRG